jgi:hypothetical protein
MENVGIFLAIWKFYDHWVHFVFILVLFQVLVSCTKENVATLFQAVFVCPNVSLKAKLKTRRTPPTPLPLPLPLPRPKNAIRTKIVACLH